MNSFIDALKTVNNEKSQELTLIRKCDFDLAFDKMAVKNLTKLKNRFDFQYKN